MRAATYLAIRDALSLAAVLVIVGCVALAMVWPWLPEPPIGGPLLEKYEPIRDGDARLTLQTLADGSVQGWHDQNYRLIPGLRVSTDLRNSFADAFLAAARRPGETSVPSNELEARLGSLTIIETRSHDLDADGKVTESWQYTARDARGDLIVGIHYADTDRDLLFDPPALAIPSSAEVGDTWSTEGKLGSAQYRWDGKLLATGPYQGSAGQFDDCLEIGSLVVLTGPGGRNTSATHDWYCAGVGWVAGETLNEDGTVKSQTAWLGASGLAEAVVPPPAEATSDQPAAPADPDRWQMTRLGRARPTGDTSEATILPTWLATDPPALLAAGFAGDLVAFETHSAGASPRWRFHTTGTVYGQPAYDPRAGRVYFGSSDKRLYALDARGLFLWSFETGDNIAARPLVVDDLVVAPSEDGTVYGIDAATGRQRWTFAAGGGIVSWPALVDGTIVVGSDDQTVYGLDPASGEQQWSLSANGAIEAPIVADDGTVYVASIDGTLAAFKPADCAPACDIVWSVKPGGALRAAPLVAEGRVVVVDEDGQLLALSAEDGKRLWAAPTSYYAGGPILVGDSIVATTSSGAVERLSLDGERLGHWEASAAMSPADDRPGFAYGPTLGGDAIWLADTSAVIRRLGAPPIGEIPSLKLAWVDGSTRPPFASTQLRNSALEYQGKILLLDVDRYVFVLDPATGAGTRLADVPGQDLLAQVDPVLAGDTLLTVSGRTMQAFDLVSRRVLWQAEAPGTTIRPPVVLGDTVLWVTTADGPGALLALDLASGATRWQASLGSAMQVGGIVAAGDQAFTSTPPAAWDVRTGAPRWQATVPGVMIGGPALAPDGQTVYVGGIHQDKGTGTVAALSASTGAVLWQADLTDAVLSPLDRLWTQDGVVVVPDLTGKVIALDAATGAERWRFAPPNGRVGDITVDRGSVWFMLENARLYGLDLQNGRPTARLVELDLNLTGQGLTQRPTFVGDWLVYPAGLNVVGMAMPEPAP